MDVNEKVKGKIAVEWKTYQLIDNAEIEKNLAIEDDLL